MRRAGPCAFSNGAKLHVGKLDGKDMIVTLRVIVPDGTSSEGKCHYVKKTNAQGKKAWRLDGGAYAPIGDAYVKFAYGAVGEGKKAVFGWTLIEHKANGKVVPHVKPSSAAAAAPAAAAANDASLCAGKPDGTYCHEVERILGYTCRGGVTVAGLQCPPPLTVCQRASADGTSLVCTE